MKGQIQIYLPQGKSPDRPARIDKWKGKGKNSSYHALYGVSPLYQAIGSRNNWFCVRQQWSAFISSNQHISRTSLFRHRLQIIQGIGRYKTGTSLRTQTVIHISFHLWSSVFTSLLPHQTQLAYWGYQGSQKVIRHHLSLCCSDVKETTGTAMHFTNSLFHLQIILHHPS